MDGVSRETKEKITFFVNELLAWNKKINLISENDEAIIYEKHIAPCVLMYDVINNSSEDIVDLGSGGGLPGIVFSILNQGSGVSSTVTMIDSDQRKCVFLEEVSRKLFLDSKIINHRIESVVETKTKILTARALSSLTNLIQYAKIILDVDGVGYFLKGQKYKDEISEAKKNFNFDSEVISISKESVVVKVQRIKDGC